MNNYKLVIYVDGTKIRSVLLDWLLHRNVKTFTLVNSDSENTLTIKSTNTIPENDLPPIIGTILESGLKIGDLFLNSNLILAIELEEQKISLA